MITSKQEAYRKSLIKRLHTVKSEIGLTDDQYRAVLSGFGVESSKQLSIDELLRAIELLQTRNPDDDKWRKRCIAAIGAYLRVTNRKENTDLIKGIACKASGYANFNKIPTSRLRDIYYEFSRKAKLTANITKMVNNDIDYVSSLN
jgi:hypothetical protein